MTDEEFHAAMAQVSRQQQERFRSRRLEGNACPWDVMSEKMASDTAEDHEARAEYERRRNERAQDRQFSADGSQHSQDAQR